MGRYLIVANQTLGGKQLDRAVQDRVQAGDSSFYVLVPMIHREHEPHGWTGGFEGLSPDPVRHTPVGDGLPDEARQRAEYRLSRMLDRIRSAGGRADGEVGDPNAVVAVGDVLHGRVFDEVIISTLPAGISRWLHLDLPSRVARMTATPVTTVEAGQEG